MKMKRKLALGLATIIAVGTTAHYIGDSKAKTFSPPRIVATARVSRGKLAHYVEISAELRPYEEIDLHAKVAGYLKFINVDIGDQVKAGQVIASIDTDELKADLDHAEAAYDDAKLEYDRISQVIKRHPGLLAEQEVDNAKAAYEMAKANVEHAKTFLDYATITVPFDGVITKRYADPGAMIQASVSNGSQAMPIVHIAENTKLRLDFPVPEPDVPFVHVGTPVDITVQATGQKIKGTVTRMTSNIDSSTRTMRTEVDVDNSNLKLMPGMYAYARIALQQKDDALMLPLQAVSLGDKPTVWKITPGHTLEEQPITTGMETADKV